MTSLTSIKLKTFNPRRLEELRLNPKQGASTILFVGSKRTGKTTMIQDILYYVRKIPKGIIVTGSLSSAETFSEFFPKSFIFESLDDEMVRRLERIIQKQEELRRKGTRLADYTTLLLFDDCGYDKKFANKTVLRRMFMNGRHQNLFGAYSIQSCKSIPPDLRNNADFIFIHREPGIKERKKLHEEFASIIPDFKTFCRIMDVCTDNYGCIVVDKTTPSNKIEDCIFYYKARYPTRKFKLGSKELWDFHKKVYKTEEEQKNNVISAGDVIIKKRRKKKTKLKKKS